MTENLYYIVIISTFVFFFLTFFIIYIAIFQNRRKSIFKQELFRVQNEIKEQTLQHISKELHDNLSQIASLIKINLNTLQLNDITKASSKIEDTKELTRHLITDLKSLSINLGTNRLEQIGLDKALETEIQRLNKTDQFSAKFIQLGKIPSFNNDKAIILYRMCQEILNNMVKHSSAPHINVLLKSTENLFTLVLSDDGVGFNVEDKKLNGGAGLINLQNRANLINALISFHSIPRIGTTVTIELPL